MPISKRKLRSPLRDRSGPPAGRPGVSAGVKVSIVIPVMNERRTIGRVLREASRVAPGAELIVVANGSTDGSRQLAEKAGARVISFDEPLGHDVGRSVGAAAATGDVILFIDGDFVISAAQLRPYVRAVAGGVDVALNDYRGPKRKRSVHNVILAKQALNIMLKRPDLKGASMTAVPHALSRKALLAIGSQHLSVPPMAQAIALQQGLNVQAVHPVNVGRWNPARFRNQRMNPLESLIVGDHLEAIDWLFKTTNERGNITDLTRNREIVR